jgi:uncharacterized protein
LIGRSLTAAFQAAVLVLMACSARAATDELRETPLEASGPLGPLRGTLLAPASQRAAVVLIIPGSGPTDRDGNSPLGLRSATYRLLAEGLGARGIASVRIDKRGMFGSASAVADGNAVTIDDYATDVRVWVAAIRQRTSAPCVWVLGHSEGGLVAIVAAQGQSSICGLVLIATAGRPIGEVLRAQLASKPGFAPLLEQASAVIDSLEAGRRVDVSGMRPALSSLFRPEVQGLLIDEFSYDPVRILAGYRAPVLVLQGERDIQVGSEDARLLKQAVPAARLVLLPQVNHVLKIVASPDLKDNLAAYSDPSLPLAPGVLDSIAEFIKPRSCRSGESC